MKKILLIDDDLDIARYYKMDLEKTYEVAMIDNLKDAYKELQENINSYHLIVLDWGMRTGVPEDLIDESLKVGFKTGRYLGHWLKNNGNFTKDVLYFTHYNVESLSIDKINVVSKYAYSPSKFSEYIKKKYP